MNPLRGAALTAAVFVCAAATANAQSPSDPVSSLPTKAPPVERLGPNSYRVGNVNVDTEKRQISVRGIVNDVTALEFIANTTKGVKAYESVLELETDAVNFNVALILIGLDASRAVPPKRPLQLEPPSGDPVEVLVEWEENGKRRSVPAEDLVYNEKTGQTLSRGPWVYTGSVFIQELRSYLADQEGVLVGFIHSPAPIIESPRPIQPGEYGASRFNSKLGLKPGMSIELIVRALPRDK